MKCPFESAQQQKNVLRSAERQMNIVNESSSSLDDMARLKHASARDVLPISVTGKTRATVALHVAPIVKNVIQQIKIQYIISIRTTCTASSDCH